MNIVLTGFMGSGKSAVGRKLAEKLAMGFIDTDAQIEKDAGSSITKIFKLKGETCFRDAESKVVSLISLLDNQVIATGGGIPLRSANLDELERNGTIVFLEVSPESALKRIGHDMSRPLLQTKNPLETAQNILEKRKKAYNRCSLKIATDNLSIDEIVEQIIKHINKKR
ncbi:MAG: shikimate kinase [bacterium]